MGRVAQPCLLSGWPEQVAPRLRGQGAEPPDRHGVLAGRIVEAEAYLGRTMTVLTGCALLSRLNPAQPRSVGLAGHAYVYAIYGRYFCMNISCESKGKAGCVLLRALGALAGLDGTALAQMARNRGLPPGATASQLAPAQSACRRLALNRLSHNGLDLTSSTSRLQVRDDGYAVSEVR